MPCWSLDPINGLSTATGKFSSNHVTDSLKDYFSWTKKSANTFVDGSYCRSSQKQSRQKL